jgi:hypothetical protein
VEHRIVSGSHVPEDYEGVCPPLFCCGGKLAIKRSVIVKD